MLLVNVSLKLWSLNMAYTLIFLLKKIWVAFAFAKATHIFFSKNTCKFGIVLTRTVNILTTTKLVKLTSLWTTGPRCYRSCLPCKNQWKSYQMWTPSSFSTNFYKGDSFCERICFHHTSSPFLKGDTSKGIFSFLSRPLFKRDAKTILTRVAPTPKISL